MGEGGPPQTRSHDGLSISFLFSNQPTEYIIFPSRSPPAFLFALCYPTSPLNIFYSLRVTPPAYKFPSLRAGARQNAR